MEQLTPQQLALYLGCEAEVSWFGIFDSEPKTEIGEINGTLLNNIREFTSIKPILRPLKDITEEEAKEIEYGDKASFLDAVYSSMPRYGYGIFTNELEFLLSKGFDLFNWIEQGLALDKTKLAVNAKRG